MDDDAIRSVYRHMQVERLIVIKLISRGLCYVPIFNNYIETVWLPVNTCCVSCGAVRLSTLVFF